MRLEEFLGQREAVEDLSIAIQAARARGPSEEGAPWPFMKGIQRML